MPVPREIMIADDHEAVWLGVRAALARTEFTITRTCRDHDEVAEELARELPHALILDFTMPGKAHPDGLGYIAQACTRYPLLPVMVLTMTRRPVLLQAMLDAGARAVVDKGVSLSTLPVALRAILAGGTYVAASFSGLKQAAPTLPHHAGVIHRPLTKQEMRVLSVLSDGCTLAAAGQLLGTSISTVNTLKRRAMLKLGMRSVHDLRDYGRRR